MTTALTSPDITLSCSEGICPVCTRPDTCVCRCHWAVTP